MFVRERKEARRDPARDWAALVAAAAVLLAGLVVWHLWAFGTAVEGGVIGAPKRAAVPLVNQVVLENVRNVFASRAAGE